MPQYEHWISGRPLSPSGASLMDPGCGSKRRELLGAMGTGAARRRRGKTAAPRKTAAEMLRCRREVGDEVHGPAIFNRRVEPVRGVELSLCVESEAAAVRRCASLGFDVRVRHSRRNRSCDVRRRAARARVSIWGQDIFGWSRTTQSWARAFSFTYG
jgi:hypothetical protein